MLIDKGTLWALVEHAAINPESPNALVAQALMDLRDQLTIVNGEFKKIDDGIATLQNSLNELREKVDDDLTNMDARFQHYTMRDELKAMRRDLEHKLDNLESEVRRIKR